MILLMKRIFYIFIALLTIISCGPSRHAVHVEMRHPSRSGIELGGKIVSVIYACTGNSQSDLFTENMADAFAEALENDYGTGKGSFAVHSVDARKGDYSQKDSLFRLLMSTGSDLVFLFGPVDIDAKINGASPVKVSLYSYDGMDKEEKVRLYTGTTLLTSLDNASIISEAAEAGRKVADSFVSQWKHEQYSIAYFDSQKWYEALALAEEYDWKGAMDIWFSILDSNDMLKRACAEYNIAVACFMLGDMNLADEWLNKSKADNDMPTLTDALRKRIDARR